MYCRVHGKTCTKQYRYYERSNTHIMLGHHFFPVSPFNMSTFTSHAPFDYALIRAATQQTKPSRLRKPRSMPSAAREGTSSITSVLKGAVEQSLREGGHRRIGRLPWPLWQRVEHQQHRNHSQKSEMRCTLTRCDISLNNLYLCLWDMHSDLWPTLIEYIYMDSLVCVSVKICQLFTYLNFACCLV